MPASSREKAPGKIGWRCIDKIQEYSNLYYMKATLEIPDELFRNVKARSALEGRPVRSVAVELFEKWLNGEIEFGSKSPQAAAPLHAETAKAYPWLKIAVKYTKPAASCEMGDIRESIARGRNGTDPSK